MFWLWGLPNGERGGHGRSRVKAKNNAGNLNEKKRELTGSLPKGNNDHRWTGELGSRISDLRSSLVVLVVPFSSRPQSTNGSRSP